MSYTKYYYYKKQQSSDNGQTWTDVYPSEMIPSGTPIGTYETLEDCEGIVSNVKFKANYSNGTSYSVDCDASSAVTTTDTRPTGYEYTAMTSAEIGNCVTSIGELAFNGCTGLTSCTFEDGSQLSNLGNGAFWGCSSLTSIDIPSGVTSIEDAFAYCYALTSCTIGSGVTSIGHHAFFNCTSLKRLNSSVNGVYNLPNNLTSIGDDAFYACSGLTTCTIPNSVTSIGSWAFLNCSGLTSVNIPTSVTSINDGTFCSCYSLSSITIPNGVTSIGELAFNGCTSLTSVTIPSGVTSIGKHAFQACRSLISITCLATTPPTLDMSDYGVFYNTNNCPIYVPCASVSVYKAASGWSTYASRIQGIPPCGDTLKFSATYSNGTSYSGECDSNSTLTTGNTHPNGYTYTAMTSAVIGECVTSIGTSGFSNCSSLTSVTIPDSVTSIGERAFNRCSGLTSVNIPSGVTAINNAAFAWCEALTTVNIPNSVQTMGYSVFSRCSGLTSVTIGTSLTRIGNYEFEYCESLQSITIYATTPPELGTEPFRGTSLTAIYVPSDRVNTYKSASGWSSYASIIEAIP